jgi:ribosomal-protein-alanine N-acetyltransferase
MKPRCFGPAHADDAARLAALHGASFAIPWDEAAFRALLSGPGAMALIAHDGGVDTGFILLHVVPPEAEILSIGVAPAARRKGAGHALLAEAAAQLRHQTVAEIFLDVASDNGPALALYRRAGFHDIARRTRYYENGADAIVMRLTLADQKG